MQRNINDPLEQKIADVLKSAGIVFIHESENKVQALDFYLPDFNLLIEVKRFHTERVRRQLEGRTNVLLIQGEAGVRGFAALLQRVKIANGN